MSPNNLNIRIFELIVQMNNTVYSTQVAQLKAHWSGYTPFSNWDTDGSFSDDDIHIYVVDPDKLTHYFLSSG